MAGTITADLTTVSLADTITGWSGSSGQLDTEVYKQAATIGTDGAYTYQTTKNALASCTFTPATNINMTANYTTPHLYWTMRCDVFPFCELLNTSTTNSGLMVRVTDGSGNYTQWHAAGRDTWDGSWRNFVLDLTNTANVHTTSGTLSLTDVDIITWYTDNSNSGNIRIIDNTWLDAVRYGEGLTAYSTTTEAFDFTDIASDDSLTANYYGVLQDYNGVLFCQGGLVLGDDTDTNDTNFVSSNETVYFVDNIVSSGHYFIKGVEATTATNPTDIDISGLVCKTVGSTGAEVDFSDTDINSVAIAGSTFVDMGTVKFATGQTISGTTFSGCLEVDTNGATMSTSTITGTSEATTGGLVINSSTEATAITDMQFLDYPVNYAIYVPAGVSSFTMNNWQFDDTNNTTNHALYWAGTVGTLTISSTNGTNLNATGCTSAGGTVTISQDVTISINNVVVGSRVRVDTVDGNGDLSTNLISEEATTSTVSTTTNFAGLDFTTVSIRARKSSSAPKYLPYSASGTVTASGLSVTVNQQPDTLVDL